MDDLALMTLQTEALYVHDERGRLLHTREPDREPAPRFFMGRTRAGNLWRFRHDLPEELVRRLDALARAEPIATDLRGEPSQLARIREVLGGHGAVSQLWMGPAYAFPDPLPPASDALRIDASNAGLLVGQFAWLQRAWEVVGPVAASLAEGRIVSVCFCARSTTRVAEAGVETLTDARRRGHAGRAVTAWAHLVRESGRIPIYSTAWGNLASQGVAGKLGLRLYGVDLSLT